MTGRDLTTDEIFVTGGHGSGCDSDDEDDCNNSRPIPPPGSDCSEKGECSATEPGNSGDRRSSDKHPPTSSPSQGRQKNNTKSDQKRVSKNNDTSKQQVDASVSDTGMIIGIVAAVSVALLVLIYAVYKYRNRDEGSYKIDESKNYGYVTANSGVPGSGSKDSASCSATASGGKINGNVKYSKDGSGKLPKKKDIKEWYV